MSFIDWLCRKEDKELRKTIDDINSKFLDDDQLWFCITHGLSVNKSDYADSELAAIKAKALIEQNQKKENNRKKLYEILTK